MNSLADDPFMNEEASSETSTNSFKFSNFQFCEPCNEDENGAERKNYTTLPIEPNFAKPFYYPRRTESCCRCKLGSTSHVCPRLMRMRSCPHERRSQQQLQRSMMLDEIYKYKRRLFNTVAAVENIGFRYPEKSRGICFPRA